NGFAPPRPPRPPAENAPAATDSAAVIVVLGSFRPERLSQVAAEAGRTWNDKISNRTNDNQNAFFMIGHLTCAVQVLIGNYRRTNRKEGSCGEEESDILA